MTEAATRLDTTIAKALDAYLGNLLTVQEKRSAARAVRDALLAEGHVRYAPVAENELGRWIVPTFDSPTKPYDDWCRVLVFPLGGSS